MVTTGPPRRDSGGTVAADAEPILVALLGSVPTSVLLAESTIVGKVGASVVASPVVGDVIGVRNDLCSLVSFTGILVVLFLRVICGTIGRAWGTFCFDIQGTFFGTRFAIICVTRCYLIGFSYFFYWGCFFGPYVAFGTCALSGTVLLRQLWGVTYN